jgi:tight adherence protein C
MDQMMLLGILVVVSVGLVIYALLPASKEQRDLVIRRMAGKKSAPEQSLIKGQGKPGAASKMMDKVAPLAMKPVMPKSAEDMSTLREKLANAGFRHESATRYFLASKTMLGIGMAIAALTFSWSRGYEPKHLFGIMAFVGGLGFMAPNTWLSIAKAKRTEKVRNGLPDSLDLLVVSVESGLGLDAGLQRVSDEMIKVHPDLSEEIQIATLETQMGVPRTEALLSMARRCGVEEMKALVAIITQAEKFGTSVAKALRIQADTLRVKRRLKAEERAQKTTVKLMIPLILFIFPSIFVVLVGPAALKIYEVLGNGGLSGGK